MPQIIFSGFGIEDIIIDLTGKTPEQTIEEAIQQINEREK